MRWPKVRRTCRIYPPKALPFDLSYNDATGVSVVAPRKAFEHGIVLSAFYKPRGSERRELSLGDAAEIAEGEDRWQGMPKWPENAESATVELLYGETIIDTLSNITRPTDVSQPSDRSALVERGKSQQPMGKRADWEQVGEPLGEGGQSQVLLVRRPSRARERDASIQKIRETNIWGVNQDPLERTRRFAEAICEFGRPESPSELGAMKVFKLRKQSAEGEAQEAQRLKSETTILGQDRLGLPRLLDCNEAEFWIVTEFFSEGTLQDQPVRYRGEAARGLSAFRSLVETVASLHQENIVHRDIKPANVFIRADDLLVLGDFGIAYVPDQSDRATGTGERVGPRDYMPQWGDLGERLEDVRPNFDVYMLGKLLWCMVAGRLRLPREYHNRPDTPEFNLTKIFPKDIDMYLINSILDRCVVEDPAKCLPSAQELLAVVNDALAILKRGGQLLSDNVPRPCRVCGKGFYRPGDPASNRANEIALQHWTLVNQSFQVDGMLSLRLFTCDVCKHVELFSK